MTLWKICISEETSAIIRFKILEEENSNFPKNNIQLKRMQFWYQNTPCRLQLHSLEKQDLFRNEKAELCKLQAIILHFLDLLQCSCLAVNAWRGPPWSSFDLRTCFNLLSCWLSRQGLQRNFFKSARITAVYVSSHSQRLHTSQSQTL